MKDITNPVAFCVICLIVGVFLRFQKGCNHEARTSPTPYYTYNGEQKDLSVKKYTSSQPIGKICKNQTAVHESAHYVVYMIMCEKYEIEARPYSLSIIADSTSLGRFKVAANQQIEIDIKMMLAGHLADKIMLDIPISDQLFKLKGYDFYNALKLCNTNNINIYTQIKEVSALIKANRDRINTVALQLEKEKEIFFKNM